MTTRQRILNEKDPEVLKFYLEHMFQELDRLEKRNVDLSNKVALKEQQSLKFEEQLSILKKKFFAQSSEKRKAIENRLRSSEDAELLMHSRSVLPELKNRQVKKLEEQLIYHDCTDQDLIEMSKLLGIKNPSVDQWEKVNDFYDESTEITVIERSYKKLIHRRQKYRLKKEFNTSDKEQIIAASGALKLLPGSQYSVDLAVSVVADKYISHIPLERQIRQMESLGLKDMHSKTLYNLCLTVQQHLLPLAEKIKKEILEDMLAVHADETPWPITSGKDSQGYMWVLSNRMGSYYKFEPTRSGKVISELLENYNGIVMCDGYTGYNSLVENNKALNTEQKIKLAHCWSHARRKFTDIESNYPTECEEILDLIGQLFDIEHSASSFEDLKKMRVEKSVLVIEDIKKWIERNLITARSESEFRKSLEYVLKYWSGLTLFLKDIRVPLTNNEAERTIRHAVMGRKNFYGSKSIDGADVAATLYTIIESCKKVEIDPRSYILEVTKKIIAGEYFLTPLEAARNLAG